MARGYEELREYDSHDHSRSRSGSLSSLQREHFDLSDATQFNTRHNGFGAYSRSSGKSNDDELELEELLKTSPLTGLTTEQASQRLRTFGPNELVEVKENRLRKFLGYFVGPIAFLIELACIISAVIKDWFNFAIILGLLFLNAIIGYVEEARAESAVDALRQTLAQKSRCWRDGTLQEIESALLVPGDIVVLRLGDIVPADVRLLGVDAAGIETHCKLVIDQSALTGESLPVSKTRADEAFSSTIVRQGQQMAIVTKTGSKTHIGVAARLMADARRDIFKRSLERSATF
ncbi:E1-E2 ATPase-domain-containing protein [Gamsiella multidivaricata]|uniref:E1-E2 ATPase-domain-containing protein n=1 Tax=Gamsiella multidivaricata TaxID=101098 RepID=UPI00221FEC62|nr:E1-E2 ATPase-domain-containing protein [Gamsiella multidivaricata]KAI7820295.1 E1-E2 ATPase-domain-containing protein [Gamsiella multidivaricata]